MDRLLVADLWLLIFLSLIIIWLVGRFLNPVGLAALVLALAVIAFIALRTQWKRQ